MSMKGPETDCEADVIGRIAELRAARRDPNQKMTIAPMSLTCADMGLSQRLVAGNADGLSDEEIAEYEAMLDVRGAVEALGMFGPIED